MSTGDRKNGVPTTVTSIPLVDPHAPTPDPSIGELVKRVKGASSRFAGERHRPEGGFKWQGSYGAFSIASQLRCTCMRVNAE